MVGDYPKISAVIICCNEEENIERCIKCLLWVDEIVVVDAFSVDRTVELCRRYTNSVYQRKWPGHIRQREYAVSLTKNQWVLSVDCDEVVTESLRDEILNRLSEDRDENDGYYMKRHPFYLSRWINHGGWYPDYKLRLFKKDKVRIGGENPHDKCFVFGKTAKLQGEITHYAYKKISDQLQTIDRYSGIVSGGLLRRNHAFPVVRMLFKPPFKFFETYVYKLGFLDGLPGFLISVLSSYYIFIKYAKLWEKRNAVTYRSAQVVPRLLSKTATSPD